MRRARAAARRRRPRARIQGTGRGVTAGFRAAQAKKRGEASPPDRSEAPAAATSSVLLFQAVVIPSSAIGVEFANCISLQVSSYGCVLYYVIAGLITALSKQKLRLCFYTCRSISLVHRKNTLVKFYGWKLYPFLEFWFFFWRGF